MTALRMQPLLLQYDQAVERLRSRLEGPTSDSGDDVAVPVPPLTDAELLWEPGPGAWSVRRRADGPGPGATVLAGAGEWGRDGGRPHPVPPPLKTIGWLLEHVSNMLLARADWTTGSHTVDPDRMPVEHTAQGALRQLREATDAWRAVLVAADDEALDRVGHSTYPHGSDAELPFWDVVAWVNAEVLHHGAEIGLLRDLHVRDVSRGDPGHP